MADKKGLSLFERFLSLWVAACIAAGVAVGKLLPAVPGFLSRFEYARVSIPVAVFIWLMIYPMMLKIDFTGIVKSVKQPKGLALTVVTNWLIKPFTMFFFAWLFFHVIFKPFITPETAQGYLAGAVLLGAAPCTAMVFVWSYLTKGDAAYTLVQVAVNDLIILLAFTPIVALLLGISNIAVPYDTLFLSVVLFVVIPFTAGFLSRLFIIKAKGKAFYETRFIPKFKNITIVVLLLTLVIIFAFQGDVILSRPLDILLIAVPLVIQTVFIFFLAYGWAKVWRLKHAIASPAAMIGASNFFELAVAVAVSLFGLNSGATLATVVGVLVKVPVMLTLVKISNRTRGWFDRGVLEEYGLDS
ncbi:MAG: ACR3 family arsenite efflux transporter [Spirochaetales bacterium]|nr:ACR3 family arsenite efflux transporter [Spirochaetales bacterium]